MLHVHEVVLRHATRRPRVSVFRGRSRRAGGARPAPLHGMARHHLHTFCDWNFQLPNAFLPLFYGSVCFYMLTLYIHGLVVPAAGGARPRPQGLAAVADIRRALSGRVRRLTRHSLLSGTRVPRVSRRDGPPAAMARRARRMSSRGHPLTARRVRRSAW